MNGQQNPHMFSVPVFSLIANNMADVRRFKKLVILDYYPISTRSALTPHEYCTRSWDKIWQLFSSITL
jgi:hypothetical protein